MDTIKNHWEYFQANFPEIYEAYENYGKTLHEKGGPLGDVQRALIKVAISATSGNHKALETHLKKAVEAGAAPEELAHTILLIAPTVGFPQMMEALLVFRRVVK